MQQEKLLIALFCCHFLADYTHLSTTWMLNAKKLGKPFTPILVHASVHGVLMFLAMSYFHVPILLRIMLTLFQTVAHCIIDVSKGRTNDWFPKLQSPANKWHWVIFGFDQLLHAIVIIKMVNYIQC